ncbi:hypothetical protein M8S83_16430 [Enterobacter asburiae]|uniref:hypothetical protein n=1 Tax=Enterobacter asburiae TaxID=61645 RepID=UPI002075A704|nr:hypothetical protein [Enterobacter asburiae]MCM7773690.1 hypothetical protein [Enterobacter asburiae]
MDILNLIEVLKPSSHVVTVKMENDSSFWDYLSKILIAILPAFISFIALLFSYFQFKTNMRAQSEQYALGIQQQLKTLKLNTRLATEIEMKKDICKEVRAVYIAFMRNHSELYSAKLAYKSLVDREDEEGISKRENAHEVVMKYSQLSLESKMLLDSYLDLSDPHDVEFFKSLNTISNMAFGAECTGTELGEAQGMCAGICYQYLARRHKEITGLVDTIGT